MPRPTSLISLLRYRRTLLLQGPMGPFFAKLATYLETEGQQVYKVNFNGGDEWFFRRPGAVPYKGRLEHWPQWLRAYLIDHGIEAIVLFGQTRPIHLAARAVAEELRLPVYVFEEGYLRPDFVTLEIGGVNGWSGVPKDPSVFRGQVHRRTAPVRPTGQGFWRMLRYAAMYGMAANLLRLRYPHQAHHRSLNPVTEPLRWLRGGWRKLVHRWIERKVLQQLSSPGRSKQWFLLPLQVHNDSQIVFHSRYGSIEAVIDDVMASFARYADPRDWLVIKHHPMDRAYTHYGRFIAERAKALGVSRRVMYVHDVHLPTLLKHTRGVITVNSTTGLQALHHGTPVITLGDCFYDIAGLVSRKPLKAFWRNPGGVDRALFQRFRNFLIHHTQLNASFYASAPILELRQPAGEHSAMDGLVSQPNALGVELSEMRPLDAIETRLPPVAGQANGGVLGLTRSAHGDIEPWAVTQPVRLR